MPQSDDRPRRAGHGAPAVVVPKLENLPLHDLPWERYELLLRRLAQEERGLRQVRLYGSRGQSQYGIDLAGQAPDGSGEAVQAKRYARFIPSDLKAAIGKFVEGRSEIPFPIDRLFVVAACDADQRQITDELRRQRSAHPGLEIEFWDRRTQCDMLRRRRDIVAEFFGDQVVEAFCFPAPSDVVVGAPPERVELTDALLRGPAEITGARTCLARADRLQLDDPAGAAEAVQGAIEALRMGGFSAHAAVLTPRHAELLGRAGRHDDAVRLLSGEFWHAVETCDATEAEILLRAMRRHDGSALIRHLVEIADHALTVVRSPLGLPYVDIDKLGDGSAGAEVARLAVLMAQTSAVDPRCSWREDNVDRLSRLVADIDDHGPAGSETDRAALVLALRIEIADVTGEWGDLLTAARRHRLARTSAAHVLSRYALHVAEQGGHEEADEAWTDAVEQGCLAGDDALAAEWIHARRVLSSRHEGISSEFEDAHRLVRALHTISGGPPQLQQRMREKALRASLDGKPHIAVPALRTLLRLAYASGCWGEVLDARELLADAYRIGTEPAHAIGLFIAAGRASSAEKLAEEVGDTYLDVLADLRITPAYWRAATAFRTIAVQADLVPDEKVTTIVDVAVDVLTRHRARTLHDSPLFAPSLLLAAMSALAALAPRLPPTAAAAVLDYLAPLATRPSHVSFHTDDSHVRLCVGVAEVHEHLRTDARDQLLDLLATNDPAVAPQVEYAARDVFRRDFPVVEARLRSLAAEGNTYASAVLMDCGVPPDPTGVDEAAAALTAPLVNSATAIGVGTGAVRRSRLASYLPASDRRELVAVQLDRAAAPYEPGVNRAEYLQAATNLSHDLDETDDLFRRAMSATGDSSPSPGDLMINFGNHPLGTFRVSGALQDTRPNAVLLAAALARTAEQRAETRERALALLDVPRGASHAVRALQALGPDDLISDIPVLATQPSWAARSLAALTWARSTPADPTLGLRLAHDDDVRVRRALASALSSEPLTEAAEEVAEVLRADIRFSVRSHLS